MKLNTTTTPASHSNPKGHRLIGLDLLRISLALLIFAFHSHIGMLECNYLLLNGFVNMGAIAMTGFFLLSGYVISFSTRQQDMWRPKEILKFYIKRIIAIIPLYYTYALACVIFNIIAGGTKAAIEELILFPIESLCLQSVFSTLFPFSHNGGSWFISCIMICYFAFPLLNILTQRITDKARTCIIIILSAILLWSPFVEYFFKCNSIYSNPFFRMLEFAIGILVCQLNMRDTDYKPVLFLRQPWVCLLTVILLVAGVSLAQYLHIRGDYMLYSWIALPCFVSLLFSLGHIRFERLQKLRTIRYLSALSFAFFLTQENYVWTTTRFLREKLELTGIIGNGFNIFMSLAICFTVANILYFLVEKPSTTYLRLRWLSGKD